MIYDESTKPFIQSNNSFEFKENYYEDDKIQFSQKKKPLYKKGDENSLAFTHRKVNNYFLSSDYQKSKLKDHEIPNFLKIYKDNTKY